MFSMFSKNVIGLDIGSWSVKAIEVAKKGSCYELVSAGVRTIPPAEPGEEKDLNVLRAVSDCLDTMQTQSNYAVAAVAGQDVAVRNFAFPGLTKDEIDGAVMLEAAQVCPFGIDQTVVDFDIVAHDAKRVCGVLAAATEQVIENKKRIIDSCSMQTVLMDVEGLALINCYTETAGAGAPMPVMIADIGAATATLAIVDGSNRPVVRDMAFAGSSVVESISSSLGAETRDVEKYLFSRDGRADFDAETLSSALRSAVTDLVCGITETIRFYSENVSGPAIESIILCGGFACAAGLANAIETGLDQKVTAWNPFEQMKLTCDEDTQRIILRNPGAFAVAAGLAMRTI